MFTRELLAKKKETKNKQNLIARDGSRAAAISKMECFVIHLGCCSRPRTTSDYIIIRITICVYLPEYEGHEI